MKKKLKSIKGFAMAELLAVSLVILVLFSVLFSNYLPLVAEYENRIMYNDVSAQYAAYYVRQIVKDAIENEKFGSQITAINNKSYVSLFKGDNADNKICALVDERAKDTCNKMIALYDIKEVIVTNYSLTKVKNKESGYKQSDGSLYEYIQYLPKYENTIYTGENDLYRIILKADNKYATTPVKVDYYTPGECFKGEKNATGLTITNYSITGGDCNENVVLTNKQITIKDQLGNDIKGIVTKIGDHAFENKDITSIQFTDKINSIGNYAFLKTKIINVELPSSLKSIGNYAFADINTLDKITLANANIYTSYGIFSKSGGSTGIAITIPSNVKVLGNNMFENVTIKSLNLSNANSLTTISSSSFASSSLNKTKISLTLPSSVTNIEANAFKNREFSEIEFNKNLKIIGNGAFKIENSTDNSYSILNLTIPSSIKTIGESAFEGQTIKNVMFASNNFLETIAKRSFFNCSINILSFGDVSAIKTIKDEAFANNGFSGNVNLPKTIKSIGRNAISSEVISYIVGKNTFSSVDWCTVFDYGDNCETQPVDQNNTYVIVRKDGTGGVHIIVEDN